MSSLRFIRNFCNTKINITNNSGREYAYVDNSFVLSPCDTSEVGSFEDGSLLPMLTYDGQYLPIRFTGSMLPEFFYELLGAESDGNVTFEMMCQIYDVLAEEGYTGATPISDYILDKLNTDNGTSYASLTDMYMKHSSWFSTGDGVYNNGIWNMTESELNEYIAQYPWVDDFLWVTPKDSSLNVQIKWPEPELAAITYNVFYQFLFSGVYGKENAEMLNPNGSGVDFARAHGIGQYMSGTALYSETNEYFKTLFADGFVSGESVDVWYGFGLDGPLTDNKYQNYWFSWYNVIELQEVKPELPPEESSEPEEPPVPPTTPTISIRKVWVEDTDETRPDSILVEIYHDEELYDTVEVEESTTGALPTTSPPAMSTTTGG